MLFFKTDFLAFIFGPLILLTATLRVSGVRRDLLPLGIAFSIAFLYANGNLTLALVIASIVLNFSVGRYLQLDKNRRVYVGAIVANLAILGYFKYSIFIKHTLLGFSLSGTWMWALPLGLSFFTFQQIAFLSDVYHKRIGFFSLKNYAMFILFFPALHRGADRQLSSRFRQLRALAHVQCSLYPVWAAHIHDRHPEEADR
ncbi:hypothetical protein [Bradyrhizobium elkanii]|uniref:hypothetical protein n=1 Tax=Bradyrhizobium elkanii TaxID=29448 RepID=UPI003594ED29